MARTAKPPRLIQVKDAWYVAYTDGGRSQRSSLRTQDLQTAQKRFVGWLEAQQEDSLSRDPQTVAGGYGFYIRQHGKDTESPETLAHVSKMPIAFMGNKLLKELVRADIEAYTEARLTGKIGKRPVGDGTVRKELTIMRAMLNFMVNRVEPKDVRLDAKDLVYVPLPPRPQSRNRVLDDYEIDTIRHAIRPTEEPMPRINLYLWLLLETGARSEALRTLTWEQVDLRNGLLHLNPWGRNQTKKRRPIIPISDDLLPILERAKERAATAWVLEHDGQIRKSMERFCERHKIEGVGAHTFRHTLATRMAQAGIDMRDIAAMLGDTMATVEKNYLHLSPSYLRGALQKLKAA
jgi:integrase